MIKQPYTGKQWLGVVAILLFLFPILARAFFGVVAIPLTLLQEALMSVESTGHRGVTVAITVISTVCGVGGAIAVCRLVWPKRAPVEEG